MIDLLPSPLPASQDEVAELYRRRRDRFEVERVRLASRSRALSNARLIAFLLFAAGLALFLFDADAARAWTAAGSATTLLAFVVLIIVHDRVLRAEARAASLSAINDEGLARLARDWNSLPAPAGSTAVPPGLAADLDLHGRASLLHLMGPLGSPAGQATLAGWLVEPTGPEEVRDRQKAVAELAPLLDWRQELSLRARPGMPDPEPFLHWCEAEAAGRATWLRTWLPRLAAAATLALLALNIVGMRPYWLLAALLNLALVALLGRSAGPVFEALGAREREYRRYAELIELCGLPRFEAEGLRRIQAELASGRLSAAAELRRLDRWLGLADARRNALISLPLQALLLWDLQVLWLLERWRARAGRSLRGWLARLGELEALAALAGLEHDEPDWVFPELLPSTPARFQAEGLGHPLIPASRRVANDVEVGPPGSFLLVTGSNLSGKSTLLRAIGVAIALAGAGGPVCARRLSLSPLRLGTSFRVQDSLEEGVSFFLAELRRLKEVVDLARAQQVDRRALLYLLDEILLGTNIAERQAAVRRVLAYLVEAGAIGAVATHDLTLASAEGLAAACQPVHFREQIEEGPGGLGMSFDYRLRPGVASTTNALKLLELLGLSALPPSSSGSKARP